MSIVNKISKGDLWELRDHRDNTSGELIKCYTLAQLSLMDGIDTRTIKNSKKYLPVRIDDNQNLSRYKRGVYKKPYRVLYIRLDEIKHIFNRKSGQKLVVEI